MAHLPPKPRTSFWPEHERGPEGYAPLRPMLSMRERDRVRDRYEGRSPDPTRSRAHAYYGTDTRYTPRDSRDEWDRYDGHYRGSSYRGRDWRNGDGRDDLRWRDRDRERDRERDWDRDRGGEWDRDRDSKRERDHQERDKEQSHGNERSREGELEKGEIRPDRDARDQSRDTYSRPAQDNPRDADTTEYRNPVSRSEYRPRYRSPNRQIPSRYYREDPRSPSPRNPDRRSVSKGRSNASVRRNDSSDSRRSHWERDERAVRSPRRRRRSLSDHSHGRYTPNSGYYRRTNRDVRSRSRTSSRSRSRSRTRSKDRRSQTPISSSRVLDKGKERDEDYPSHAMSGRQQEKQPERKRPSVDSHMARKERSPPLSANVVKSTSGTIAPQPPLSTVIPQPTEKLRSATPADFSSIPIERLVAMLPKGPLGGKEDLLSNTPPAAANTGSAPTGPRSAAVQPPPARLPRIPPAGRGFLHDDIQAVRRLEVARPALYTELDQTQLEVMRALAEAEMANIDLRAAEQRRIMTSKQMDALVNAMMES